MHILYIAYFYRQANPCRLGGWVSAMLIVGYLAVDSDYALSAGLVSMYDLYRVLHLISLYTCMILTLVLFYRLLTADPGMV